MQLYKKAAEVRFVNEKALADRVSKMRPREFAAYISVLSQIHEDLDNQIDLEKAVKERAGDSFFQKTMAMIHEIGAQNFESYDFADISAALTALREQTLAPAPQETIPGVQPAESTPAASEQAAPDLEAIMEMESAERMQYLSSLDYPAHNASKANVILNNLKGMEEIISDPEVPSATRTWFEKEIAGGVQELLKLLEEKEEPKEEEEATPTGVRSPDGKMLKLDPARKKKVPKEKVTSFASLTSSKTEADYLENSILDQESFKKLQASSKNPYIDFSVVPPVFNEDIQSAAGDFLRAIQDIKKKVTQEGNTSDALKKQFNDLICSFKIADYLTYVELVQRKKNLPPELNKVYADLEFRLFYESPSAKILEDDNFDNLYLISLAFSSPTLKELIFDNNMFILKDEAERNQRIQEADFDDLRNKVDVRARSAFESKAERFFDLASRIQENNFIEYVSLKWENIFNQAKEDHFEKAPGYIMKPCPTCYKWVKWNNKSNEGEANENKGFRIRLVSNFTGNPKKPKITLEELNSRKWPALKSTHYSEEREKKLALKYEEEGMKSWAEIQQLLLSNNPEEHEEGWHRRAGALHEAGGMFLGNKDKLIRQSFSECPFGANRTSNCGVLYSPQTAYPGLPKGTNLQPQWNLIKDTAKNNVGQVETLIEDVWEDKELFARAKQKQSGGFKFSKINFACTCRIQNVSLDASYKHSQIAISKAGVPGSPDYVYPTLPNGQIDETIPENTLAYMVCGAPTSLSSFDRDPQSFGYVLNYLKRIETSNPADYQSLCHYLMLSGVDVQDIMDLDLGLATYQNNKETTASQERIQRITEIIKQASIKIPEGSELREYLGGLTLVCPFGHRFTIEHSLKFGGANVGIFQKEKITKTYGRLLSSTGNANIQALIKQGILIEASRVEGFPNKLHYPEWRDMPNGTVFPDYNDKKRPILLISIPIDIDGTTRDYVFAKKGAGIKRDIWLANDSYLSPRSETVSLELLGSQKRALSDLMAGVGDDGDDVYMTDLNVASDYEIENNNPVAEFEYNRMPSKSIPGAGPLEHETGINVAEFSKRIASFSRALKSALRIILTWTKGVVSEAMMTSMLMDYKININPMQGDSIADPLIRGNLLVFEDLEGEPITDKAVKDTLIKEVKLDLVRRLNEKANKLYDWIRSNVDELDPDENFDEQITSTLLVSVLRDFNSPNPDIGFSSPSESGEVTIKRENFDSVSKSVAAAIIKSNKSLAFELTLKTVAYKDFMKKRVQYNSRVALIGYAQYLSNALQLIYRKYCKDPESHFYIGYDIGVDLSTSEGILGYENEGEWIGGITEADIEKIPADYATASKQKGAFKRVRAPDIHYGYRIDKAWEELEAYLNMARNYITSNRSMEFAKEYMISRMKTLPGAGEKTQDLASQIMSVFPSRSMYFSGTTTSPESGARMANKRRLPYLSRTTNENYVLFNDLPGFQTVQEYLVRNVETNKIYAFAKEPEAERFREKLIAEETAAGLPPGDWVIEPDPYYINPKLGFDSRKTQIGLFAPKNTSPKGGDLSWPPVPGGMDFVGIIPPFDVPDEKTDNSISKAAATPMTNFRFEVLFDGESLDISPLIRRGNEDDLKRIMKIEDGIIEATAETQRNIAFFGQENASEIARNPKLLDDFKIAEEAKLNEFISAGVKEITGLHISMQTVQTYVSPPDVTKGRRMIRFLLEDPMRAYKIIKNPAIRGKDFSPGEQDRLLRFVIKVFGLDQLAKFVQELGGKFSDFDAKDLFENIDEFKKPLSAKMKQLTYQDKDGNDAYGWRFSPGEYFELIPGNRYVDRGSYLQYVYHTAVGANSKQSRYTGTHPNMKDLVNVGMAAKKYGQGEAAIENNEFIEKIEKDMLNYIQVRTSGERKNHAKDRIKKTSEYFDKIQLRRFELDRTILSVGLDFEDVELPNF